MTLQILPARVGGAAENMAADFLLLQRYPETAHARFRHYEWRTAAFTFGYAQKFALVRQCLPPEERFDLCRRPTGGGLVDHREDWTYALVIPRGHPLEEVRATQSYRAIHEAVAATLRAQGCPAVTREQPPESEEDATGVCFERAELHDVVNEVTARKIAGAAQKRNKHGLLFQGSINKAATATPIDWDVFHAAFATELAAALHVEPEPVGWPEFAEDEWSGLTEQYSSPEWLEFR